jgi:hypothetical protein
VLFPVETTTRAERASLLAGALSPLEKTVFGLPSVDESVHVDAIGRKIGIALFRSPGCAL